MTPNFHWVQLRSLRATRASSATLHTRTKPNYQTTPMNEIWSSIERQNSMNVTTSMDNRPTGMMIYQLGKSVVIPVPWIISVGRGMAKEQLTADIAVNARFQIKANINSKLKWERNGRKADPHLVCRKTAYMLPSHHLTVTVKPYSLFGSGITSTDSPTLSNVITGPNNVNFEHAIPNETRTLHLVICISTLDIGYADQGSPQLRPEQIDDANR